MNIFELHESAWKALLTRRARLPHALLLLGQKGLGKSELAREFAALLLCEDEAANERACGKCLACNWFAQGNHPDFRLLQPEALSEAGTVEEGKKKPGQQITIDQIRELDDFLGVGSHRGGLSIVLVNPAEAMNRNAANAILKILEEPPPDTLFVLVSGEPERLLPTIRSRCQTVPVAVPVTELAQRYLNAEGVADAASYLALSGGSPRIARELAASGQASWLATLTNRLASGGQIDVLPVAAEMDKVLRESKGGLQLRQVVEGVQKWLVDLSLAANDLPIRYFLAQQPKISALADMIPPARLVRFYRLVNARRREAEQPLNARLFLENLFLDYRALFDR